MNDVVHFYKTIVLASALILCFGSPVVLASGPDNLNLCKDMRNYVLTQIPPEDTKSLTSLRSTSRTWRDTVDANYPEMFHKTTITSKNISRFLALIDFYLKKKRKKGKKIPPVFSHLNFQDAKLIKKTLVGVEIFSVQSLSVSGCTLSKNFISKLHLLTQVSSLTLVNSVFRKSFWKPKDFELPKQLRHLCINGVDIPQNQGVKIYALPSLEELHLSQNTIRSGVQIELLKSLKELNFASNSIKGSALKSLGMFEQLESLLLDHNPEISAQDLIDVGHLSLRKLSLKDTRICSGDIPKLVSHFDELTEIHLGFMRIHVKDLESAKKANPGIKIFTDCCTVE